VLDASDKSGESKIRELLTWSVIDNGPAAGWRKKESAGHSTAEQSGGWQRQVVFQVLG